MTAETENKAPQHRVQPRQIHLPAPRLELVWSKTGDDWTSRECVYSLIIPMKPYDCRANDSDGNVCTKATETVIELGRTKGTGGNGLPPISPDGSVQTPFRDGAHAKWDAEAFGGTIPVIAVCGNAFSRVEA